MVTVYTCNSTANPQMVLLFRVYDCLVINPAEVKVFRRWSSVLSGCHLNNTDLYLSGVRLWIITF